MASLTFYRQARIDGGVRSGVDVDGVAVFERFQSGTREPDPVLRWYIDVRAEGKDLPREPEQVRAWFLSHASIIKPALLALAEKLQVGIDDEVWPYEFPVAAAPKSTTMTLVVSAVRGLTPGSLAKELKKLGREWNRLMDTLSPPPALTGLAPTGH
jgi:hypothetical protein